MWVESDAINVAQAMKSDSRGCYAIHHIYDDIGKDSLLFDISHISNVQRDVILVAQLV